MVYEAVQKADGLAYGRLHDPKSGYSCAIGTLWDANANLVLKPDVVDEVTGVNDMFDGKETPRQRKLRVLRWLRLQIDISMTHQAGCASCTTRSNSGIRFSGMSVNQTGRNRDNEV